MQDRLSELHGKIGKLNEEIVLVRQERDKIVKGNRKKERKIYLAEREFIAFKNCYEYTISG